MIQTHNENTFNELCVILSHDSTCTPVSNPDNLFIHDIDVRGNIEEEVRVDEEEEIVGEEKQVHEDEVEESDAENEMPPLRKRCGNFDIVVSDEVVVRRKSRKAKLTDLSAYRQ